MYMYRIQKAYHIDYNSKPGEGELVEFLAEFSRGYAANIILGKEFLEAVICTVLHPYLMMPFCRISMMATNMASPANKVVDGIARLLRVGDIDRIKSSKMRQKAEELETFLEKNVEKYQGNGSLKA